MRREGREGPPRLARLAGEASGDARRGSLSNTGKKYALHMPDGG